MQAITERHVQAIWYDSSLRPPRLVTRRGSEVVVVSPGEWNLEAGPDFRHAVLEIGPERRRICGDVEIHLCPSDWDLHGHGTDPNYRNVIAHVTWGCGPVPDSLPPGAVSIWLGRFMTSSTSFSPDQIDLTAYPYQAETTSRRPCETLFAGNPDLARKTLVEAGCRRLRLKARRLEGRLAEARATGDDATESTRQVFYEEVMTALGYKKNERPFRSVAMRIPIATLPADPVAARNAFLVAGTFEDWERGGCRPHNSPERRLASAAEVFTETPTIDFAAATDFTRDSCRTMVREMCGEHFLGAGRAAAVMANVVVPFALAEGNIRDVPEWLPPEDVSSPVRLAAFRLFGRDHNPRAFYSTNGLLIQGLLQIHREKCQKCFPYCAACGLSDEVSTRGPVGRAV